MNDYDYDYDWKYISEGSIHIVFGHVSLPVVFRLNKSILHQATFNKSLQNKNTQVTLYNNKYETLYINKVWNVLFSSDFLIKKQKIDFFSSIMLYKLIQKYQTNRKKKDLILIHLIIILIIYKTFQY